jgi:hypothetical protein
MRCHNFGLLSVNYELSVIVFRVTEEAVVINAYLSLLVTILQTELYILRETLAFLLGKGLAIIVIRTSPLASIVLMDSFSK